MEDLVRTGLCLNSKLDAVKTDNWCLNSKLDAVKTDNWETQGKRGEEKGICFRGRIVVC